MSNKQWQEGKTYQFKPDMIEGFKELYSSNEEITAVIRNDRFTVESVTGSGAVLLLIEFSAEDMDIIYWFDQSEIKYFDLIEDTTEEVTIKTEQQVPSHNIIVEWLEKLQYVVNNDNTVGYGLMLDSDDVIMLSTDFGDITGTNSVCNFILNRYNLLQHEAKHKKNNELMERKAKLEAELAGLNKELGNV